ncbi:hypothetical protein SAMN05444339_108130 [Loktanella atrilutea]|uniref:Uncharacterized protein n=1 Tax=Loktanella atrilutea TaxID=366533 RepID=A0A1M5CWL0_LOKAT|nr:hypothetical protein SAMN05444339_108130 [Loktanella atrilutea]
MIGFVDGMDPVARGIHAVNGNARVKYLSFATSGTTFALLPMSSPKTTQSFSGILTYLNNRHSAVWQHP